MPEPTRNQAALTLELTRNVVTKYFPDDLEAFEIYSEITTGLVKSNGTSGQRFNPSDPMVHDALTFVISVVASVVANVIYGAGQVFSHKIPKPNTLRDAAVVLKKHPAEVADIVNTAARDHVDAEIAAKVIDALTGEPPLSATDPEMASNDAKGPDLHQ